jgi:hypothetical protein
MMKLKSIPLMLFAALAATQAAHATEGGGSIYPMGAEGYSCCGLPPPGFYALIYGEGYHAGELRDNNGNNVAPPNFSVTAFAVTPRLVWVTPYTFAGGSIAVHALLPLVTLNVKAGNESQRETGLGDMTFGPAIGWHLTPDLHVLAAVDFFAPTGQYDKDNLANLGRNYWAIQPIAGISYGGHTGPTFDAKFMWTFNQKNHATDYQSGQEFIVDYSAGWGFSNGWTVGAGGYYYRQMTDDSQNGQTIADNRGRSFAIGPAIKYTSPKHWFVTAKYEMETDVLNRPQGSAFWIKAVFPI